MWVCTNVGFISIVTDKSKGPDFVKVRARKQAHLKALFPSHVVHESDDTDYRWRIFATRADVAQVVSDAIMDHEDAPGAVCYGNFKDSVKDRRLHDLYADFWTLHFRYQHEEPKARTGSVFRQDYRTTNKPSKRAIPKAV